MAVPASFPLPAMSGSRDATLYPLPIPVVVGHGDGGTHWIPLHLHQSPPLTSETSHRWASQGNYLGLSLFRVCAGQPFTTGASTARPTKVLPRLLLVSGFQLWPTIKPQLYSGSRTLSRGICGSVHQAEAFLGFRNKLDFFGKHEAIISKAKIQ